MMKYRLVSSLCGGAFFIVLAGQGLVLYHLPLADELIVVHYTRQGIDQFGSIWQVLSYGLVAWSIIIMNFLIALELEERDWLWGKVVAGMTLGLAILLFISFQAIISVN